MIGAWRRAGTTLTSTTWLASISVASTSVASTSVASTSSGPRGVGGDARQTGDDAVDGLDKITAQMAGGEHRPEQQEMCRAVAEALITRTHLVVQAGTGTGKSLAYLVPAGSAATKVVVATATKALQDQLAGNDLPMVDAGLGLPAPLDYAVLKGRSNYICRQRVAEVGSGGIQPELGDQGPVPEQDRLDQLEGADGDAGSPGAGGAEDRAAPPEGLIEEVRTLIAWSQKSDTATGPTSPSNRPTGPGTCSAWGRVSARAPSTAPREVAASPRPPATGRRRPTWSS